MSANREQDTNKLPQSRSRTITATTTLVDWDELANRTVGCQTKQSGGLAKNHPKHPSKDVAKKDATGRLLSVNKKTGNNKRKEKISTA